METSVSVCVCVCARTDTAPCWPCLVMATPADRKVVTINQIERRKKLKGISRRPRKDAPVLLQTRATPAHQSAPRAPFGAALLGGRLRFSTLNTDEATAKAPRWLPTRRAAAAVIRRRRADAEIITRRRSSQVPAPLGKLGGGFGRRGPNNLRRDLRGGREASAGSNPFPTFPHSHKKKQRGVNGSNIPAHNFDCGIHTVAHQSLMPPPPSRALSRPHGNTSNQQRTPAQHRPGFV